MKKLYEIFVQDYGTGDEQTNSVYLTETEVEEVRRALEKAKCGDEPVVADFTILAISDNTDISDLREALEGFLDVDIFA
jgi:hypothetical protein